jgi:hypothetical protein
MDGFCQIGALKYNQFPRVRENEWIPFLEEFILKFIDCAHQKLPEK